MISDLSAIPLQPEKIESVTRLLAQRGLHPHIYQNMDVWEQVSGNGWHASGKGKSEPAVPEEPRPENCLLLVGSLREIAEEQLPSRVAKLHPGLPVIVVGESPSLREVVLVIRQGATDVVDLSQEPASFCNTVEQALSQGREGALERQRVRQLRERLQTLTNAERDVFDAMLDGYANKETAKKLGIGLRTVELRRAKIMAKMGAKSVAELVKLFCEARCPGVNSRVSA